MKWKMQCRRLTRKIVPSPQLKNKNEIIELMNKCRIVKNNNELEYKQIDKLINKNLKSLRKNG